MKFIDTNVFVYAADSKNPAKRTIARNLITAAVSSGGCRISVQVLNEFASVAVRKLGLTVENGVFDKVVADHGTVMWPNGADLCPDEVCDNTKNVM